MEIWKTIISFLSSITKKDLIYGLIILILALCLNSAVRQCSDTKAEYKNNVIALNDTIHYYKAKNGDLVATKHAFEADINTLKTLNESLYNEIKNLKSKADINSATYFSGVIEHPKQDTVWVVEYDTIVQGFIKNFSFIDTYRTLEGNVYFQNDSVGLNIDKDEFLFDYTVALDEKNNIMIKSSNPYVRYNQISGFQLPKEKVKRWSLDAFGGIYTNAKDIKVDAGLSLNYSLYKFGVGPCVYYENNLRTNDKTLFIGGTLNFNILKW